MIYNDDELNSLLAAPALPADRQFSEKLGRRLQREAIRERRIYIGLSFIWVGAVLTTSLFYFEVLNGFFKGTLATYQLLSHDIFTTLFANINPFYLLAITIPLLLHLVFQTLEYD
jgi:hypothetical protein